MTSSLASTVPRPGHQLTGASEAYASRYRPRTSAFSTAFSSFQERPPGTSRSPDSNRATSSEIGRAFFAASSYQELKICRKIHWVHL
ncbi:hypothetical protein SGLAM104S_04679 [Streptomyces glaucescens]